MGRRNDPVERASDGSVDLQDVSTWEPRSPLDWIALALYRIAVVGFRWGLILAGLVILLSLVALGGLGAVLEQPIVTVLVVLSAVPAFLLAAYVWYADVTTGEPLHLLVVTFFLAILFAGFAALVNDTLGALTEAGVTVQTGNAFVASTVVFFLVVAPIEELVKLLAVRLYAYRSDHFDAVIDGAVYGAAAGLGFATIENALFIGESAQQAASSAPAIGNASGTAVTRALVGPGHVLYSAIAGYFLGLAKFNPDNAVPITLKGLLVAVLFHAIYNTGAGVVPATLEASVEPVGAFSAVVIYVVGFNLVVGYYLYRKLKRYRSAFRTVGADDDHGGGVDRTEFDPSASSSYPAQQRGRDRTRGRTRNRQTRRGRERRRSTGDSTDRPTRGSTDRRTGASSDRRANGSSDRNTGGRSSRGHDDR